MPDLVIDTHQHFWDLGRLNYPWMSPDQKVLYRNYLPSDLAPALQRNGVDRTVIVQACHSLAETRWLLELAAGADFVAGVVGWVDLTAPDLPAVLDEFAPHPYFKGVRHLVHDEPDEAWLLRPEVLRGLRELERRGIPYDVLMRPPHLKHGPRLAELLPNLPMVVDHLAKPYIARGIIDDWARELRALAQFPNVYCKLSGMITEANHDNWKPSDLTPYLQVAVEAFGYDRVMYGSDWPVCLLAGTYDQAIGALRTALGNITPDEQARVFGRNAQEFYRL